MRYITLISILFCSLALSADPADERTLRYEIRTRMPEKTFRTMRETVESLGGVVLHADLKKMEFRVPDAAVGEITGLIASTGMIRDRRDKKRDVSDKLLMIRTELNKKREHLSAVRDTIEKAELSAVLSIMRTINDIVLRIEELEGRMRQLTYRVNTTRVTVYLNQYGVLSDDRHRSGWKWVNELGVRPLIRGRYR